MDLIQKLVGAAFLLVASAPAIVNAQGQALPYYTGFDTPQEKAGWAQYRLGFQSTYSWSSNGALSHDYNVGGDPSETVIDWYVSPALDCTTGAILSFKWQGGGFSQPTPDNCEVYFSDSKADPALGTFTLVANISSLTTQYKWQDTVIDLPFMTDSGYIAFKYKTVGAAWMTYGIDSIWVKAKPSTVSLSEQKKNAAFRVSPNPFSASADLVFITEVSDATVTVYDIQGQRVYCQSEVSGRRASIEVEALSQGIYFVEVTSPGRAPLRQKVIIQH